jgi:hypothetical protein
MGAAVSGGAFSILFGADSTSFACSEGISKVQK